MAGRAMPRRWKQLPLVAVAALAISWTAPLVAAKSAADYFVHSLPGAPEGPLLKMFAGHIEVTPEHNGNMFFWHFQNKHIANKQRTVIWLNGGPGCSSEDGALMEIGPYRLKDQNTLVYNDGSWNEFANIMFVDNPVGTGFSYVDTDSYVHELDEMANQFVTFLEKWFALFPEYEHDDLYFAGESYAGQYIPYIARAILDRNKKGSTQRKWNLAGLLIGNGWISPKEQYEAYLQYGYARGIVEKNSDTANKLEVQHRICQKELAINEVDRSSCEAVLQEMLRLTAKPGPNGKLQCYNMYDIRLKDDFPACGMNWPPDLTSVTPYLRRKDVTDALHVNAAKNTGWHECDGAVGTQFRATKSRPSVELLPDILKEIPVILFSGAEDLICSHLGTEALISNMAWNGGRGFELSPGTWAPRRAWTFEGEEAGFWQTARNLTYVLFNNSSHMVPFDYPRRTRDMLDRFMGVDISSIGGQPTDSRLDGEKGPETTVGGAAGNGTADQNAEKAKVDAIKWDAYRKSGEIVLVIVAVAAAVWGYYIWRDRRKSRDYQVLAGGENGHAAGRRGVAERGRAGGLENFRNQRANRDIEAGDFDESELDDLHLRTPTDAGNRYSVGGDSEESVDEKGSNEKQNGQSSKA
ncbi:Alpha/Beta hydrolase protein [Podospora aff. communis PSN243]|uniref:Pheromone-processing carboxypeptidase KEX1 n=1 Tax=Podospora aff. communis PSN243 TaxID=3040156 RepID=A0AAV9H7A0_9PEZI|nr:Alpha/Beta hydrolase protein [Podospora aff. communis PSN243]